MAPVAHPHTDPPKRVLVIAYYFPPMGLSGVQRVAKFVKYLPQCGWQPVVLTVAPGGYFAYDESLLREVTEAGAKIHRTRSIDPTQVFNAQKTVSLPAEGKRRRWSTLSQWLFVPDNKIGWFPFAVREGLRLLRDTPCHLIYSTAPPYTAHLVGAWLQRKTGLPLVLDYRDDWVGNPRHHYPTRMHERLSATLERWAMRQARAAFTINEPIRTSLARRNPRTPVHLLPQGFDPADFDVSPAAKPEGKMRLVYSGIFYDAQTPDFFLRALAEVLARQPALREDVEALFVGLVPDQSRQLADELGLANVVSYAGYVDHRDAVAYLKSADVLWMTIGRRPGAEGISTSKLFEYFGAKKPILALVPGGAARDALAEHGAATVVAPDDVSGIAEALLRLFAQWKQKRLPEPNTAYLATFDRRRLTAQLAAAFDACLDASDAELAK